MREPTGNEDVYNDQDRRSQWTDFVALASSHIAEEELLQQLDRGIGQFGWRYPALYEALFRQFPAVYYMLERARTLGITFGSCMAGSSSRRQSHIKRAARAHALTPRNATAGGNGGGGGGGDDDDDACPALLVMAGMQPTMFICKDANFGAPCIKLEVPPGMCVDIPEPYTQQGSSFQPNEAAGSCMLYDGPQCSGFNIAITSSVTQFEQGPDDGINWNDRGYSLLCKVAPDLAPAAPLPPPMAECEKINRLTIFFKLGSFGTPDRLDANIGGVPFWLATNPAGYLKVWKTVDLKQAFNSANIPLKDISAIGIQATQEKLIFSRSFKLGGISLAATCSGSGQEIVWDRWANSESGWIGRSPTLVSQQVWSTKIALGEWHPSGGSSREAYGPKVGKDEH
ncbi:hypothetical protein PLIIFM63780_009115 [Purpureocillium lilacinum]|nr:hypothetical protein PLIIFM63780_009115 [Purpureocillium lilacinum]